MSEQMPMGGGGRNIEQLESDLAKHRQRLSELQQQQNNHESDHDKKNPDLEDEIIHVSQDILDLENIIERHKNAEEEE